MRFRKVHPILTGAAETIAAGLRLYDFADTKYDWGQGHLQCSGKGMQMVEIRCVEEEQMVDEFLSSKFVTSPDVTIDC